MIENYGNTFIKWRESSSDVWADFTEHNFVNGLKMEHWRKSPFTLLASGLYFSVEFFTGLGASNSQD